MNAALATNSLNLLAFHRGGILDALVRYGGSPAYANYVFGVYNAAAELLSLSAALTSADVLAALFSRTVVTRQRNPVHKATPASNVANITQGYYDYGSNSLCHK